MQKQITHGGPVSYDNLMNRSFLYKAAVWIICVCKPGGSRRSGSTGIRRRHVVDFR